jgi:hypothetical protein
MADIDAMMNKIAALLAKAEATQAQYPEEAKTYREKAESLMRKYRIEEEQMIREAVSSGAPIWKDITISSIFGEWREVFSSMFDDIARHCGVRWMMEYKQAEEYGRTVGYEMDVRLVEMIFTAARLAFLARMEPEFDTSLSAEENIYRLRGSGMDRQSVAEKVFGRKGHSEGIKVGAVYRAECEKRGEVDAISGRGFNASLYRVAYADQFATTIRRRLREARDASDSHGGAVVLPEREARVREAFYVKYPYMRPETPEQRDARKAREEAREAALTPEQRAQRQKDAKVIARRSRWNAHDQRNWDRLHGAASQRARRAGEDAARSVDLTREAPKSARTDSAERTPLEG